MPYSSTLYPLLLLAPLAASLGLGQLDLNLELHGLRLGAHVVQQRLQTWGYWVVSGEDGEQCTIGGGWGAEKWVMRLSDKREEL